MRVGRHVVLRRVLPRPARQVRGGTARRCRASACRRLRSSLPRPSSRAARAGTSRAAPSAIAERFGAATPAPFRTRAARYVTKPLTAACCPGDCRRNADRSGSAGVAPLSASGSPYLSPSSPCRLIPAVLSTWRNALRLSRIMRFTTLGSVCRSSTRSLSTLAPTSLSSPACACSSRRRSCGTACSGLSRPGPHQCRASVPVSAGKRQPMGRVVSESSLTKSVCA